MSTSIETTEREAVEPMCIPTATILLGQIKVMAELLQASVGVLRTFDPESAEERELLQTLIDQCEAAIATVLTEHAMGKPT
jgi:hypothetical protein